MKKYAIILTLLLLFGAALVSCKSAGAPLQQTTRTDKTVTVTETVHDTVVKVEKDNSYYEALLECQNNKVVVKNVKTATPGKNVNPPKVVLHDNKLSVDCEARAHELFLQWKARNISTEVTTYVDRPVPVEKDLSFLQEFQIWAGRIFLILILAFIAYAAYQLLK
jgi:hypothetical protein